jgi:hypothetical protein
VWKHCIEIRIKLNTDFHPANELEILIVRLLKSDPSAKIKSNAGCHVENERSNKLNGSTRMQNITKLLRKPDWIQNKCAPKEARMPKHQN